MIRVLFWLTLLANIVLFAWFNWRSSIWSETVVIEPALHEEQMQLLDATQAASEEHKNAAPEPTSAEPGTVQPATELKAASAPSSTQPVCLDWGEFTEGELKLVAAELAGAGLADAYSQQQHEQTIGYWVYIAPLKNKAAINQKLAQLNERGVTEHFVVQEPGQWNNAISLGVFRTEEAAQGYLKQLHEKHVPSAQAGKRSSKLKVSVLEFRGISTATAAKLAELKKNFTGSEIKVVQCALTR